eukprot:194542-Chlamydomonas_euryale.AAC.1
MQRIGQGSTASERLCRLQALSSETWHRQSTPVWSSYLPHLTLTPACLAGRVQVINSAWPRICTFSNLFDLLRLTLTPACLASRAAAIKRPGWYSA